MANKPKDWPTDDDEDVIPTPVAPIASDAPATTAASVENPAAAPVVVVVADTVPVRPTPKDLAEALVFLKNANAMPEANGIQQRAKQIELAAAQRDYHRFANGEPASPLVGDDFRDLVDAQTRAAKAQHLEALGRKFPVVAELLSDYAELKALLESAK